VKAEDEVVKMGAATERDPRVYRGSVYFRSYDGIDPDLAWRERKKFYDHENGRKAWIASQAAKVTVAAILLLVLVGCGAPAYFDNRTPHGDLYLDQLWTAAQEHVATAALPLNPQASGTATQFTRPDAHACMIFPHGLIVQSLPDVAAAVLDQLTPGLQYTNPTGEILCPQPCDRLFDNAYSEPGVGTYYARSFDATWPEASLDDLLRYEFEAQILYKLGYDVRWR